LELERICAARARPPGRWTMLDIILDGFGLLLLVGQAALFLVSGPI
jgi:hypothetical protein